MGIGVSHYFAFHGQLEAMRGQLAEMKSASEQTNKIIEANTKLVTAAATQAEASNKIAEANVGLAEAAQVANRAWISPRYYSIIGAVQDGQKIQVRVLYDNAGKTPATKVEFRAVGRTIAMTDGSPVPLERYLNPGFGTNEACDAPVTNYVGVIYPASNQVGYVAHFFTNDLSFPGKVIAKTAILAVQGCFRYRTLDSWRSSRFCTYLHPEADKAVGQWQFSDCADGNEAE